jgi:hypothetical protein
MPATVRSTLFATFVATAVALGACAGSPSPSSPTAATSVSLSIACAATALIVVQQTSCTASVMSSTGAMQDQTAAAQWSSSNAGIATVSAGGLVTAVTAGTVDITARMQGVSGTRTLTVSCAAPTAGLAVRFSATSSYGLSVALQDVTTVTFDASGSKGAGLVLRMSYGDGAVESRPYATPSTAIDLDIFTHQYHSVGTFNAQLVVTDSQGRESSTGASITVKSLTGTWGNVIRNPSSGVIEARLLTLVQRTSSTSANLTGRYTHPAGDSEALTGSVESTGTIRTLALNSGTITMSGNMLDGNGVTPDASAMKLIVKGGSADGLTLTFVKQ